MKSRSMPVFSSLASALALLAPAALHAQQISVPPPNAADSASVKPSMLMPALGGTLPSEGDRPRLPSFSGDPADGQWTLPGRDTAGTRYSGMDEINVKTVKDLRVAFTFSLGVNRGQEAAPLVVGSTLYVVTAFPNILYALDLAQPGAPMKWAFKPEPKLAAQGVACCDVVNRGAIFYDGKIIYNTLDDTTVAVDAETGKQVWRTVLGDINKGETMTMAPMLAKDKIIVGDSGGELGVRGWATALDGKTGRIVWRAYNTGPDKDVLIGTDFKPFYAKDRGRDLGVTTWPTDMWKQGGGTVWGWVTYDPDLNLVYYGTSNPGPWNSAARPGDNKWTAGIFARDADTGQARWFYQYNSHDLYDHDGVNESVLLDMDWKGSPRKVLVHPDRNGFIYLMDRTTGEVLSTGVFHPVNSNTGVDLKTGDLKYVEAKRPRVDATVKDICPSPPGAKDWNPTTFSPRTGLYYVPHNNLCMDMRIGNVGYIEGTPYLGSDVHMKPGPGGNRGVFDAWNIAEGKVVWSVKEKFPVWSGAVATAGDIVFYGTMDGWFKALDAKDGKLLWQFKTGSGIIGQPTVWKGPDGHEYVGILSGVGGWAGAVVSGGLDTRDGTSALGFVNAMKDLPDATTAGGTLYVFSLPKPVASVGP